MSKHDDRLLTSVRRYAQSQARSLAKDLREEHELRAKARKEATRRREKLGALVVAAGASEWAPEELIGALLDAADRMASPTVRLAFQLRGGTLLGTGGNSAKSDGTLRSEDNDGQVRLASATFGRMEGG